MKPSHLLYFLLLVLGCGCSLSCNSTIESCKEVRAFAKHIEQEKNWTLVSIGGTYDDPKLHIISAGFECQGQVTIDEARQLLMLGIDEFLEHANTNKRLRRYLPTVPLTYRNISFSLAFIQDGKTPAPPYIGYANLFEGRLISYSTLDPSGRFLTTIHKEPMQETVRILAAEHPEHPFVKQYIATEERERPST